MTIEAKLDETNKLLRELIESMKVGAPRAAAPTDPTPSAPSTTTAGAGKVTAAAKKAAAPATKPAATPPPAAEPAATSEETFDFDSDGAAEEPKKITVDDARKALVNLQKALSSPEASRGVLKANGVASLASLKDEDQEKIAAIIAGCAAKMPK